MNIINRGIKEKATPVTGDVFYFSDSENINFIRYIEWSDLVALLSGGVSDGDKGDITVSGSGSTWTIDNGIVTEAKQVLADNTTHNVSTSMHGYVPKATGETTKFLRADGFWETISGSGLTQQQVEGLI